MHVIVAGVDSEHEETVMKATGIRQRQDSDLVNPTMLPRREVLMSLALWTERDQPWYGTVPRRDDVKQDTHVTPGILLNAPTTK